MEAHGFDVDLVLEPRLSARRAWIVASAAGGLSLILATALVLVLPLRETQVFTVLVDRQTGDAENILQVAPTGHPPWIVLKAKTGEAEELATCAP